MARLISLYRDDIQCPLGRRELPVPFDENIAMVMKLPELNLNHSPACLKGAEMDAFVDKCRLLSASELIESMKVSSKEVFELISQNVPCVGCRRSVERLFRELVESGQDAMYPVTLSQNGILGLVPEVVASKTMLFVLLKYYGSRLSPMVEAISTKSRQTRRCPLHSLDAHRARPTGLQWRPLWDSMAAECREELTLVEADILLDTMEAYLQKHRFCPECRLKVLRAYSLLVGEVDPSEEKGYKPLLYLGLKCCPTEKHIHVQCNTDLISLLIARAEPELVGSTRRERHAKTMEVAQEEVVTCVGICLLERLQRVAQRLREEEQMVDMLQFASLQALRRSFEMAVESKRGVSQLELLCEELSREEAAQKQRKEMKRLRRKKRRGKKDGSGSASASAGTGGSDVPVSSINEDDGDNEEDIEDEELICQPKLPAPSLHLVEAPCTHCHCSSDKSKAAKSSAACVKKIKAKVNNNDEEQEECDSVCRGSWSAVSHQRSSYCFSSPHSCSSSMTKHSSHSHSKSSKHSATSATSSHLQSINTTKGSQKSSQPTTTPQDSGYSSNNSSNLTTPEGSDVACTEGLCNHHSGSPIQNRPSPSPVPEGVHDLPDLFLSGSSSCDCYHRAASSPTDGSNIRVQSCPIHVKMRDNCCSARTLQQMLEDWSVDDEEVDQEDEESYIPLEEVQAFRKQQQHYNEQRLQLRHDLRLKFDQLCGRVGTSVSHSHSN